MVAPPRVTHAFLPSVRSVIFIASARRDLQLDVGGGVTRLPALHSAGGPAFGSAHANGWLAATGAVTRSASLGPDMGSTDG